MAVDWNIQAKDLTIGYSKNQPIIRDINIQVQQNTLVGLVGRNGTGKSTFIKTLSGLLEPLSGSIQIFNQPINQYSQKEFAKQLSILLSQQYIPGFTKVHDLISLGRFPYTNFIGNNSQEDEAIISRAIKIMDIENLQERMAISLSDGEKQKVMLARALAQDTPILVLDEPTTFLDLPSKLNFFKHLERINMEMEKTILIASHEWNLLEDNCSDFIVFENGEVTQKDTISKELSEI